MLKKTLISLVFAGAVCACSTPKPIVVTPAAQAAKPKPRPAPVTPVNVSIDVPAGWVKETQAASPELHVVKRILTATKGYVVDGDEVNAVLTVTVGRITPEESATFIDRIVEVEQARRNAKVLDTRTIKLDGQLDAVELVELRQLDAHTLAVMAVVATAKDGVGVLAACGTLTQAADEVLPTCAKIVESLSLK
jgi:hypothetical protein